MHVSLNNFVFFSNELFSGMLMFLVVRYGVLSYEYALENMRLVTCYEIMCITFLGEKKM